MHTKPEGQTPKASFKEYLIYASIGGFIHPIAGGVISLLLIGFDLLYTIFVSESLSPFALTALLGTSPLGIFVTVPMFILAGAFYNIVFGLIYNATKHGKANSVSNRILFSILFSYVMAVIGPVVVYSMIQAASFFFSSFGY